MWIIKFFSDAKATDWAITVLTGGLLLVSYWQWQAISGQLGEMKASGKQTDALIGLFQQQVYELKKQVSDTHDLAVAAGKQAIATSDSARQAARSANTAKDALQSSIELSREDRRPWVGLQAVQCNGCTIEADRSLKVGELLGVLANTGRTPALQMIVHDYVAINVKKDPIPDWPSIEREQKEMEERSFRIPPNLPPDMAAEITKSLEDVKKDMAPEKTVLPPNGIRTLRLLASVKVGRDLPTSMRNMKVTYVVGQITYFDARQDRQYTTTFCMRNDFGIEFRFCPTGNDMK